MSLEGSLDVTDVEGGLSGSGAEPRDESMRACERKRVRQTFSGDRVSTEMNHGDASGFLQSFSAVVSPRIRLSHVCGLYTFHELGQAGRPSRDGAGHPFGRLAHVASRAVPC